MRLWDDERGQSVQIGAVLLFAVLVVAFSSYQAVVVPDQNREVEFTHSERVQQQLHDLRNAVVSMAGGGSQRATAVQLGARYPSRAVAVNPPPPAGALRTAGTGDARVNVSIRNAVADGETGDVWNGTPRNYTTGGIVYDPGYNVYENAPTTVYEHTVLYNQFDGGRVGLANQTLVDGDRISLVAVNGSVSRSSAGSTTVDLRPVSAAERTVGVSDDGDPITIAFATRLPAAAWERRLAGQEHVTDVREFPGTVPDPYRLVEVELERGVTYQLQLTKVGVGNGATPEDATYLADRTAGTTSVRQGETADVTVEARDDYNNPVRAATVNASVSAGSVSPATATTGENGRVTLTYDASGVGPGTYDVNVSLGAVDGTFDNATGENVTVPVTVTAASAGEGSGGAYALSWADPSETDGNGGAALSDCSSDACVWDVGGSDDGTLALEAAVTPPYGGVDVEYAVDNGTVAGASPATGETGSDGVNRTTLTARENGMVDVLASASDDSDVLTVEVTNVTSGGPSGGSRLELVEGSGGTFWGGPGVAFDLRNAGSAPVTITAVTVEGTTRSQATRVAESQTGSDARGQHEVYVDSSAPGILDVDGRPYYLDDGAPLSFGTRAAMTENATFDPGTTGTVNVYAFRNNGGNAVGMSGSEVTVTVHLADGTAETYTVPVN